MPAECKLSIITVNYNGIDDTCAMIDSLPPIDGMEIIVVDNASKNDEATAIAQRYPHITVIRSDQNLGFAGGNNLGIKAAHGEYLFFVNNDTEFLCKEGIDKLMERMDKNPSIGMICPKIRFHWNPQPIQFAGYTPLSAITLRNRAIGSDEADNGQYDEAHPTPYAHGAAMLTRKEAIDKVGLMPECYFLYYEELDWSMMFRRAGYEIWYDPAFTIFHKESKSTGQASPLKAYYITRNRFLLAQRNIDVPQRYLTYLYLLALVALRDIIKYTLKGEKAHIQAIRTALSDFIHGKKGQKE